MSQWHSADELLAAGLTSDSLISAPPDVRVPPQQAREAENQSGPAEDAPKEASVAVPQSATGSLPANEGQSGNETFSGPHSRVPHSDSGWSDHSTSSGDPLSDAGEFEPVGKPGVPERSIDADPVELAREIVLRRLTIRAHSRAELVSILRRKNVPEEASEEVLNRMEELRLIDDAQFAEDRVRSMQIFKGLGKRMMAQSLRDKGIDEQLIENALAEVDAESEHSNALVQAEKKLRTLTGESRDVAYRRTAGFLARRGYSPSTVNNVLAELLADWGTEDPE